MNFTQEFEKLKAQTKFNDDKIILDFYDSLPAVRVDEMIAPWKGGGFDTGHPTFQGLHQHNWFGKWYKSKLDAIPLVCKDKDGNLYSDKIRNKGEASLWEVEFRGKVSGTMVYDGVPIFDHFRKVNDNTLMGLMNGKDYDDRKILHNGHYFFFYLERLDKLPLHFTETPNL